MGLVVIFRALGFALSVIAVGMLIPFAVALAASEGSFTASDVGSWAFGVAVVAAASVGLLAIGQGPRRSGDLRNAIIVVLLFWLTAPLAAAVPFMAQGLPLVDAYFEAASALTTTGAWLSESAARTDNAGVVWRALLQWIGGLASLAIAAAIFIRPVFIGIDTLLPPFTRGERQSDLVAVSNAIRSFSFVYAGVTALCALVLMLGDVPTFDAIVSALSIAASGGFTPHQDGIGGYGGVAAGVALPFVFLSGANFVLISRLALSRRRAIQDIETGAYAIIVFGVGLATWLLLGAGDLDLLPAQFFNAASLMSTNGFIVGERPLLPIALVAVLIGGSAVSTAGGIKVIRWLVIFRRAREEVRRLVSPHAVLGASAVVHELGVWTHFLLITVVLALLTLVVASGGHPFDLSVTIAAGLLSNAGPVIHLVEAGAGGYGVVEDPFIRFVMALGMVLGRIETVTALALLNASFWRS